MGTIWNHAFNSLNMIDNSVQTPWLSQVLQHLRVPVPCLVDHTLHVLTHPARCNPQRVHPVKHMQLKPPAASWLQPTSWWILNPKPLLIMMYHIRRPAFKVQEALSTPTEDWGQHTGIYKSGVFTMHLGMAASGDGSYVCTVLSLRFPSSSFILQ